jgi:hypothetical protein
MEDSFMSILSTLFKEVQKGPDRPLEDIIRNCSSDLGLDEKDLEIYADAVSIIDRTTEKMHELAACRKAGGTRDDFLEAELERLTENLSEEEAKAVREAFRMKMDESGIQMGGEE